MDCQVRNVNVQVTTSPSIWGRGAGGVGGGLPGQASCSPASFGDAVGGGQDAVGLGMEVLS